MRAHHKNRAHMENEGAHGGNGQGVRGEPHCDRCGLLGGTECYYDGLQVWLHPHCTRPWIDAYEARHNGGGVHA